MKIVKGLGWLKGLFSFLNLYSPSLRFYKQFSVPHVLVLMCAVLVPTYSNAATYYPAQGGSVTSPISIMPGTHTFVYDNVGVAYNYEWYDASFLTSNTADMTYLGNGSDKIWPYSDISRTFSLTSGLHTARVLIYDSSYSQLLYITTWYTAIMPGTPSALSASSITKYTAGNSWSSVSGATYYTHSYKESASATWIVTSNITGTSKGLTPLKPGTSYDVKVKACNAAGCGGEIQRNSLFTTIANTAPGTVGTISKASGTTTSLTISWGAASDTDGGSITAYEIERYSTAWSACGTTSATSRTCTALAPNTSYKFRVRAQDNEGAFGAWKESAYFTTDMQTVGTPSSIYVPSTDDDGAYSISWGASATSGVTYILEEATNSSFTSGLRIAYTGAATSSPITGRATGATYYYRVKATRAGWNDSSWRVGGSGVAVNFSVSAPQSITVPTVNSTGNYTISWSASVTTGASYILEEATNSGFTSGLRTAYSGTSISANIINRPNGTTYYYRVKATKSGYTDSSWQTGANGVTVSMYNAGISMVGFNNPSALVGSDDAQPAATLINLEDPGYFKLRVEVYKIGQSTPVASGESTSPIEVGTGQTFATQLAWTPPDTGSYYVKATALSSPAGEPFAGDGTYLNPRSMVSPISFSPAGLAELKISDDLYLESQGGGVIKVNNRNPWVVPYVLYLKHYAPSDVVGFHDGALLPQSGDANLASTQPDKVMLSNGRGIFKELTLGAVDTPNLGFQQDGTLPDGYYRLAYSRGRHVENLLNAFEPDVGGYCGSSTPWLENALALASSQGRTVRDYLESSARTAYDSSALDLLLQAAETGVRGPGVTSLLSELCNRPDGLQGVLGQLSLVSMYDWFRVDKWAESLRSSALQNFSGEPWVRGLNETDLISSIYAQSVGVAFVPAVAPIKIRYYGKVLSMNTRTDTADFLYESYRYPPSIGEVEFAIVNGNLVETAVVDAGNVDAIIRHTFDVSRNATTLLLDAQDSAMPYGSASPDYTWIVRDANGMTLDSKMGALASFSFNGAKEIYVTLIADAYAPDRITGVKVKKILVPPPRGIIDLDFTVQDTGITGERRFVLTVLGDVLAGEMRQVAFEFGDGTGVASDNADGLAPRTIETHQFVQNGTYRGAVVFTTTDGRVAEAVVDFVVSDVVTQSLLVTASAGNGGGVTPLAQPVTSGSAATFTVTPQSGYTTNGSVGGTCASGSWSGNTYTTGSVTSNCSVSFSFTQAAGYYIASATAGTGGSVTPTSQSIAVGGSAVFTVTPENGYTTNSAVGGTCPAGNWNGSTYTTGAVTNNCSVSFSFTQSVSQYAVSASAGTGGNVTPTSQSVVAGETVSFTVTPQSGYTTNSPVGGTCPAGSWAGTTYTTSAITYSCSVSFSFSPLVGDYTVSASAGAGGSVSTSTQSVMSGETASFAVTPDSGYTTDSMVGGTCPVGSWSGAVYTTGAVTADCSVSFTFSPVITQYNVSATAGVGGSVGSISQTVTSGEAASFSVTPDSGYTNDDVVGGTCPVGSWSGAVYTTGAVMADCSVSFSFSPVITQYTVSATAGVGGSIDVVSQTVTSGNAASFILTPDSGYTTDSTVGGTCPVGSWSGAIYTTGAITADCSVSFSFTNMSQSGLSSLAGWRYQDSDAAASGDDPTVYAVAAGGISMLWTQTMSAQSNYVRTGDVSGASGLEVVAASGNEIRIFDRTGLQVGSTIIVPQSVGSMILDDVDEDGVNEILVGVTNTSNLNIYIYEGDGTLKQAVSSSRGGSDTAMFPVAYITGRKSLIVGYNAGYAVDPRGFAVFDLDQGVNGTELWYYDIGPSLTGVSVADIDGDNKLDFVGSVFTPHNGATGTGVTGTGTTTTDGDLYTIVVDEDGTEKLVSILGSDTVGGANGRGRHVLVDLEDDGTYEIVASVSHYSPYVGDSQIRILNLDGSIRHQVSTGDSTYPDFRIGDLDGDGDKEIVVLRMADGVLSVYDEQLNALVSMTDVGNKLLALSDVDGDGTKEILVSNGSALKIYDSGSLALEHNYSFTTDVSRVIVSPLGGATATIIVTTADGGISALDLSATRTLVGMRVEGLRNVPEGDSAQYYVVATWDDNTESTLQSGVAWAAQAESTSVSISPEGILSTVDVTGNKRALITATYNTGSVFISAVCDVWIIDEDGTSGGGGGAMEWGYILLLAFLLLCGVRIRGQRSIMMRGARND